MIFKEIAIDNDSFVLKDASITKFNSMENKTKGYVFHNRQNMFSIVFAYECNGVDGDDKYTLISLEKAKTIIKTELMLSKEIRKETRKNLLSSLQKL